MEGVSGQIVATGTWIIDEGKMYAFTSPVGVAGRVKVPVAKEVYSNESVDVQSQRTTACGHAR